MKYRKLGSTGIEVSEIGFGSWGIGGQTSGATSYGVTDDSVSTKALQCAYDLGVTFYDTSDLYGYGHSEELLGNCFRGVRDRVVIASKVGFLEHNGPQDFSRRHIEKSVEGSLKRLKTDYIDLYQLHSPPIKVLNGKDDVIDTLVSLKQEGKIRAYGISARSPEDALVAVEKYGFDVVQVNFNLIDQRALNDGLLESCGKKGVGFICRTPLCFGFLSGRYSKDERFDSSDHRSAWPEEQVARWATAYRLFADSVIEDKKQSHAQIALRFCLSHPGISTVIPGMLVENEVCENVASSQLGPFNEQQLTEIKRIYDENEFFIGK